MPFLFYDPTIILLIPAIGLALWAQFRVKSAYRKYQKIAAANGMTGSQIAQYILRQNGVSGVEIEPVAGELSDHYDPRVKKVRLSENNFKGRSLAAIAVAAHEVGHAIQHAKGYEPLKIRHTILPVTSFASMAAFPLVIAGFFLQTPILMDIGIYFYGAVVLFHMVTLPVEFNASSRALANLQSTGLLMNQEISGARKVLNAAALTYVAAAAVSLIHLVRLLILRGDD
jgi:Zn-dependent membrane protease YugP